MEESSIKTIEGMLSFDATKMEIGRLGIKLSTTTDDFIFALRLESLKALINLAGKYINIKALNKY